MKFLFLLVIIYLSVSAVSAQDPTKVVPTAYQTTFENEFVRVQRVHYEPRVILPEHDHTSLATAYVYLNDAGPVKFGHIGLSYGAVTRPPVKAGSFRLYKGVKETHTVESLSDTASDFLRVEFKTDPGKQPNSLRGKFFGEDVPSGENFQKVQFENEQVRITRLICAAGKSCLEVANAKEPILFVILTDAQFKIAKAPLIRMRAGDTHWIEAGKSVAGVNIGKTATEVLRFDFKTGPIKQGNSSNTHDHSHAANPVKEKPKAEASELLKRGAMLESQGNLPAAIELHEQALALNKELVQAHINLIALFGRIGQFAKAESHYRAALEINPDLPVVHYNFGVLCVEQERYGDASKAFELCLKLDPNYAEAHFSYAALIEREGKLDEAAKHYRKAIENQAGYRAAHFALGRNLVNQNKLNEAIGELLETLTPEDNETPRYMYALGATYIRAGDKSEGIQYLREALKRAKVLRQTELVRSLERDLKSLGQ